MLNKAIKTMETIRKAEETRAALTNEALEALEVLGYEYTPGQTRITIKRGHIVEVQTVKEVQVTNEEELNRVYEENARHIRRINELAAENEQLREELAALKQTKEEQNNIIVKEADAMEQTKTQPKKTANKLAGLKGMKKDFTLKEANEELKAQEQTKEAVEETNEIKMTYKRYDTPEAIKKGIPKYADLIIGVNGTDITINDKSYKFKARREFYMPIIYGCFDEEVVEQTREEINKINRFRLSAERTTNDPNFKYAQDKEHPIVVWRLTDDNGYVQYHGYAKTALDQLLVLAWEKDDKKKSANVARMFAKNLFTDKENWRTLRDNKVLADKFRAICADIWPEDFTTDKNESQDTNEIVVDFTNDPTAGCDDLDI